MSQRQLAEMVGVHKGTISKWEAGVTIPPVPYISLLFKILGMHLKTEETTAAKSLIDPLEVRPVTKPSPMENIGKLIRGKREEWEVSKTELGNHLGVDRGTIASWENDEFVPNVTNLNRIQEWLKEDIPEKSDKMADSLEVVELMKERRLAEGLNQIELAQILGVSKNRINVWEKGQTVIRSENFNRIIKWLASFNPEE